MNPKDQDIAVAKACGLIEPLGCDDDNDCINECLEAYNERVAAMILPSYGTDLNAMHEAEKLLTPDQEEIYVDQLSAAIMTDAYENEPRYLKSHLGSADSIYRATAAQRREAFLRTLGLWKE